MNTAGGVGHFSGDGTTKARGHTANLANPSPRKIAPLARVIFHPWQIERATRLHRICQRVLSHAARGESLSQVLRAISRAWHGKRFRSDRSKAWRLSPCTLYRVYAAWLQDQRPETFLYRYQPGTAIPRALVNEFRRRCELPGTLSTAAARDSLARDLQRGDFLPGFGKLVDWLRRHPRLRQPGRPRLPFYARSFTRALPPAQRAAIKRLHRARRLAGSAAAAIKRADQAMKAAAINQEAAR